MNDFLQEVAAMLNGFPVVILNVIAPFLGSVAASVLAMSLGEATTPKEVLRQFVVGYLAGAFGGPLGAKIINAPTYTINFLAGGSGYWFMRYYLKKKQQEMLNNPTDNTPKNETPL